MEWLWDDVNAACPQVLDEQTCLQLAHALPWPGIEVLLLLPLFGLHTDWTFSFLMGNRLQGLVVGVLLLLVAAGCQPLVLRHFGHSSVGKRLVAVTAAAGVLLVLLRPPMPVKVRPHAALLAVWDQVKVSSAQQQAV